MMENEECIEYEAKIQSILDYADGRENFNLEFVMSVRDQLLLKEFLTDKQKLGINNIINKFGIEC